MTPLKPYEHVPLSSLRPRFDAWKNILTNREVGNVYFLPHEDIHYRAYQFRDWCVDSDFSVELFDLEADLLHDEVNFKESLMKAMKPVILIARSFFFVNPDALRYLNILTKARLESGLGILILHEGFPSLLASNLDLLPESLRQHEVIHSLFDKETMIGFLTETAKEWSLPMTAETLEKIWQSCGGNIWLAKDVIRGLRDNHKESVSDHISSSLFLKKANLFWEGIPESHRFVLVHGKNTEADEAAVQELLQFGFSFDFQNQPLYLQNIIKNEKLNTFSIKDGHVQYKKTDLTREFSNAERRVLLNFSQNEGIAVSRDSLGESFWQAQKLEE